MLAQGCRTQPYVSSRPPVMPMLRWQEVISRRVPGEYILPRNRYPSGIASEEGAELVLAVMPNEITLATFARGRIYYSLPWPAYFEALPTDDQLRGLSLSEQATRRHIEGQLDIEGKGSTFCLMSHGNPNHLVRYRLFTTRPDETIEYLEITLGCMGSFGDLTSRVVTMQWSRSGVKEQ